MNLDWTEYINHTLNVTMHENYGATIDSKEDQPLYEIVFKIGTLVNAYDDGLIPETRREGESIDILIRFTSVKCVEIFNF
jgi:hypothetical protein